MTQKGFTMRKALAAAALTSALATVPALDPVMAQAPAQEQAEEDEGDGGNWGLLGLIGLLGLAGLAGLRRKHDDYRTTGTTMTGTAPRTTEGATSSNRRP
jgi:MYXO-CTERM domain-containing protein